MTLRTAESRARERAAGHAPFRANTPGAGGGAPLAAVGVRVSIVLTALRRGNTARTAAVGRNPQTLPLLKVTVRVGAERRSAD